MGEINGIFKELVAIKRGEMWFYTMNRSLTSNQLVTIEEIRTIISQEYPTLLVEEMENEVYVVSNIPLPCKNC